ncbi:hypothetical protein D3C76_1802350 [compost metagenome]
MGEHQSDTNCAGKRRGGAEWFKRKLAHWHRVIAKQNAQVQYQDDYRLQREQDRQHHGACMQTP